MHKVYVCSYRFRERILSTRITEWLRQSEKLRVDLDHYQNKVEDLNQSVNKAQNKGKNVNDKDIDKLKRLVLLLGDFVYWE